MLFWFQFCDGLTPRDNLRFVEHMVDKRRPLGNNDKWMQPSNEGIPLPKCRIEKVISTILVPTFNDWWLAILLLWTYVTFKFAYTSLQIIYAHRGVPISRLVQGWCIRLGQGWCYDYYPLWSCGGTYIAYSQPTRIETVIEAALLRAGEIRTGWIATVAGER